LISQLDRGDESARKPSPLASAGDGGKQRAAVPAEAVASLRVLLRSAAGARRRWADGKKQRGLRAASGWRWWLMLVDGGCSSRVREEERWPLSPSSRRS